MICDTCNDQLTCPHINQNSRSPGSQPKESQPKFLELGYCNIFQRHNDGFKINPTETYYLKSEVDEFLKKTSHPGTNKCQCGKFIFPNGAQTFAITTDGGHHYRNQLCPSGACACGKFTLHVAFYTDHLGQTHKKDRCLLKEENALKESQPEAIKKARLIELEDKIDRLEQQLATEKNNRNQGYERLKTLGNNMEDRVNRLEKWRNHVIESK